ncbi:MAG: ABC transporter substrate-binding protein [Methanocorpusculum sp.]|nr:ABC transporter substrate-binding protein [Methanocorpusculum sp.]
MRFGFVLCFIATLSLFAAAAGCIDSGSEKNVLIVGNHLMSDARELDQGTGTGTLITEKIIITETLVATGEDFSLKPNLAESWKMINDTTWEFKLREDVKFHNGDEMTAADVKFSIENINTKQPGRTTLIDYRDSEIVNKYTIRIRTNTMNPLLPAALHSPDTAIISPKSYDANGEYVTTIGTGPMKLASFNEQTGEIVVVRHDQWWGGTSTIEKIINRGYPNPNTRAMIIENHDVDMTFDPPYSEVARLDAIEGIDVLKFNTPRTYKLDLNFDHAPLDDLNVRKALAYAVDRQGIVDNVLYGVGSVATGPFLPTMAWANTSLVPYTYNQTLAKQYLADAGWTDTNGDGYVDKDGKKLRFKLLTYTERPGLVPMLEAISSNLKDIGIEVEEIAMETGAISPMLAEGDWDMYLIAANLAMVPDPEYVLKTWYTTDGTTNRGHYSNTEVDRIVAEGHNLITPKERYAHFRTAEGIVYDEVATINVAYYGVAIIMWDNVQGFTYDPTAHDYRLSPFMTVA